MSEHKYIIRNCPCNVTAEDMCDWENTNETYCQDCTDCVLKQIVELCKEDWEDMTVSKFQSELLNKLEIQEVE